MFLFRGLMSKQSVDGINLALLCGLSLVSDLNQLPLLTWVCLPLLERWMIVLSSALYLLSALDSMALWKRTCARDYLQKFMLASSF